MGQNGPQDAGDELVAGAQPEGDRAHRLAVFASARLVDAGGLVGALRFDPDDAGRPLGDGRAVSGWSAFSGEETEEELTDAERMRLPSLAWLVQHDPAVVMVTAGHDGTAGYWARAGEDAHGMPLWERLQP